MLCCERVRRIVVRNGAQFLRRGVAVHRSGWRCAHLLHEVHQLAGLNVSGVVNATNEFGSTINDPFDCRAYFVDGSLEHTLVLFNHGH